MALGSSQLRRFGTFLEWLIAARYLDRLAGHDLVEMPTVVPGAKPAWHFMFAMLRLLW